jgi:cyclic-di-AMP phosphodiesterase PgpH
MAEPASTGRFVLARRPSRRATTSPIAGLLRHAWPWTVIFVVATTFAFAPALTFRVGQLRAGSVATRDVVAPRDLILADPETTERKRQQAAAAVLPVYDDDSQATARLEEAIHTSFSRARAALAQEKTRRKTLTEAIKEAFTIPASDAALAALTRGGFSSEIEDRLVSIVNQLYRHGIVDNKELLLQNRERGIELRDTVSGAERHEVNLFQTVEYGADAKAMINGDLTSLRMPPADRRELATFLAAALRPNLTYNAAETTRRRQDAARSVESVFLKIPRGKVIVRRGDEITDHTAYIISQIRGSASNPSVWLKIVGILLLESLTALALYWDARRRSETRQEAAIPYVTVLLIGVIFAWVVRGSFSLAQAVAASFQGGSAETLGAEYFAIPFAAGPIVMSLIGGIAPAVLFSALAAVGVGVLMGQSFSLALFALAGSLTGVLGMTRLRSRGVLVATGGLVAASNIAMILASQFLDAHVGGAGTGWDFVGGVLGGLFVAAVVGLTLPVFETLFNVTTDIRLLELSNQNLPLLKALALEAPGTYQHSMIVGHLAEASAEAVGADALLARVCAYYHDIGKIKMPMYFVENQMRGQNRHDRLEPSMSALIIASHVKEGVEMGKKARLPEPIVNAIREHHGTKLIRYFYQKALTKSSAYLGPVVETDYRHAGPKPSTRVNGILMICDAVEAASRTLIDPTPSKISAMIHAIVSDCLRDGQFDDCDLTMRDLAKISEALQRTLAMVFHHRIDYPGFDFNRERTHRRSGETHVARGRDTAGAAVDTSAAER